MCTFLSGYRFADGSLHFHTDADVEAVWEAEYVISWADMVGHDGWCFCFGDPPAGAVKVEGLQYCLDVDLRQFRRLMNVAGYRRLTRRDSASVAAGRQLCAEGDRLYAEGHRLEDAAGKLCDAGSLLYYEGNALRDANGALSKEGGGLWDENRRLYARACTLRDESTRLYTEARRLCVEGGKLCFDITLAE